MEKKNLLIASDCFLPRWDGVARFLSDIIPPLANDYKVTVLAPKFKGKFKNIFNIKLIRFDLRKFSVGDYTPANPDEKVIRKEVREADIVWVQTIGPIGMKTINLAKRYKKPILAYTHSIEWELVPNSIHSAILKSPVNLITKIVARNLYNKCDLLMVPSLETAEIMSWQGIKTKKEIVHLGTSVNKFVPAKDKAFAKKQLGIDPINIVIGFTGRLGREKDIPTLARAFARLQKRYKNLCLLVIGEGVKDVKNMLLKIEKTILPGSVDNILPYLQAMDIYVLPSLTETTSLTTLEAMSCGLAVVCTPVGYIKRYIKNNVNGMLFPKKQPYFLAKKLEKLIDNFELREKLGKNARETIINEFDWENTVKEIKETLAEY